MHWPHAVLPMIRHGLTCEYASLTRAGAPITWPLTPYHDEGSPTVDVSTGVTYPSKAERARRDPRVSLLFSDPTGSGLADPPVVLVQGLATVRDADLQETTDRYVRRHRAKMPEVFDRQPWFLVRRQTWYWARMWIEVTPLRIRWWPGGALDAEPECWTADPGVTAPPSDPAPPGAAPAAWARPPADWRPQADRAMRLGAPVLTVRDADGWPLPLRTLGARRVDDGFVVRTGPPGAAASGPACLTFHAHPEAFTGQENVVLIGRARPVADGVHVTVERSLADFSLAGGRLRQLRTFAANGRKLAPRLDRELARRAQPAPVVRLP
ncbi:hemerythrin [Nonomuraea sp. NN258]|uniref:hemerythrin n=1 Tax=Nonomuraea antri TaxID=2730852 RepID=UPI00156A205A|nr:hemerythrin [Nonomuraea antri]NRQ40510.1 hemerythrin [Nonomuraea antri]